MKHKPLTGYIPTLRKLLALLIAGLVIITPPASVLAQSTATSQSQSSTESTNSKTSENSVQKNSNADSTKTELASSQSPSVKSGPETEKSQENASKAPESQEQDRKDGPNTASLAAAPAQPQPLPSSTIKQALPETGGPTGALVYSYPIVVPPGRNGLQPDLKLSYNSQTVAEDNLFGKGWSINIPYIQRLNKTGSEKLYSSKYFTSSMDGDLVYTGSIDYPYYYRPPTTSA